MRILDSKDDIAQKYLIGMPDIKDVLSQESKDHFYSVLDHLENLKVPFTVKNTLVRGLDYYTETVFEIVSDDLGTKNTVCGGGRYNDLISQLGGGSVPAIGFAFGVERLAQLVMAQHPDQSSSKPIHLIGLGDMPKSKIFNLAHKLRHSGISCDIGYDDQLKTQLKKASQKGCPFVVIIGEEELDKKIALVKNMTTREQEEVPISKLTGFLKKGL